MIKNYDTLETIYRLARIGLSKEQIASYYGSLDSFWDNPEFTEMYVRGSTSSVIATSERLIKAMSLVKAIIEVIRLTDELEKGPLSER